MPHSLHICLAVRCYRILHYSLRFGFITCHCIYYTIILYNRAETYCPIFTLSGMMPSVLHILHWSIIGLRWFSLVIQIHIVTIVTLIPIQITGFQAKPRDFSHCPLSLAGGGDVIALIMYFTLIFVIPAAYWHPEMQFVIAAIVVYWDFWVSASDLRILKCHFWGQVVKTNSIVNTPCFHADNYSRCLVLPQLNPILNCRKSAYIDPLLIALQ